MQLCYEAYLKVVMLWGKLCYEGSMLYYVVMLLCYGNKVMYGMGMVNILRLFIYVQNLAQKVG